MALLKFLKGNYSSLNSAAIVEGQVLICGDTGEMFVDVAADKRVKIGDYVTVESLDALFAIDATSVPASRLYYVEGANILARSNGTDWDQINKDTGATSIEVVGEGNAVTAASYDAVTRKLTLTKGATFATKAELDTLDAFVGDIPEGYTEKNVIAYINKKAEETLNAASGGSSESAASVLGALNTYKASNDARVEAVEKEVDDLQAAIAEDGSVTNAIAAAQSAADNAQKEVDELETVVANYKTANDARVKALEDVDNATQAEMDAAVKVLEDADAAILAKIGTVDKDETVVGLIEAAQAKADAAYVKPVDGIGADDLHANVVASLAKADSALQAADIENKADKATTLAGYGIADAYTKDEVDAAVGAKVAQSEYDEKMDALDAEDERIAGLVSAEVTARGEADAALDERLVKVEAFFEGAAEDGQGLQNALDTLVEIQNYIDNDGKAAETMVSDIADNAKAIEDEANRADEAEQALSDRIDDLSGVVDNKAAKADLESLDGRVEVVEGKVSTLEGEMDAVEQKAADNAAAIEALQTASSDYALDANLDAAVERIADNETAIGELQAASATHATAEDLSAHIDDTVKHIDADERTAWNKAITDLSDHKSAYDAKVAELEAADTAIRGEFVTADGKLKTELQSYADQVKVDAIADAKTETESQVGAEKTAREQADAALQSAINVINDAENGILAQAKSDATSKANTAEDNAKSYIEDLMSWGTF